MIYEEKTVEELRKLASARQISGRSEMNRDELIRTLASTDQQDAGLQSQINALTVRVEALENRVGQIPNQAR